MQEIAKLADTIDFAGAWPGDGRDMIYQTAHRACRDAWDGLNPSSALRSGLSTCKPPCRGKVQRLVRSHGA
nr:DUF982 domain-containing protein [Mesorhizobium hawassense]